MSGAPISVVVPVHNGERYLAAAIQSLLDQTTPAAEIIVVDDGSTDGSMDVASGFGAAVHIIRQPHRGVAATRNTGVRASTQPYVAWLDQDDLATPLRLGCQLAAFDGIAPPDVVFGHMIQFVSPEVPEELRSHLRCDERPQPAPLPSCFMAPVRVFELVGEPSGDGDTTFVDWYLRAKEHGLTFHYVAEVVTHRRIHGGNRSYRNEELRRDYVRTLKAALDRRRRSDG